MTDYKSIACSAYDVLERASLLHSTLTAQFRDGNGNVVERQIEVTDLFSENKQEFMKATDRETGEHLTLRLDQIVQLNDGNTAYLTDRC